MTPQTDDRQTEEIL